jgi:hypothetical protein
MLIGTLLAGAFALLWQAVATHNLGAIGFAPVATCWTVAYLASTVVAFPIESWAAKTAATGTEGRRDLADAVLPVFALVTTAGGATFIATLLAADSLFAGETKFAPVCGLTVVAFSLIGLIRGTLAGEGAFSAYGILTALDAAARLALVGFLAALGASAFAESLTIPLAASVALLWLRRLPAPAGLARGRSERPGVVTFLLATIAGGGASQVILIAGPVVLAAIGGTKAAVTVLFVTLTLARSLLFLATPIATRFMPSLSRQIALKGGPAARVLSARIACATVIGTAVGALLGATLWPPATQAIFGVRSTPGVSAVAVAGTVLAMGGLALSQVLVASGRPRGLALSWWLALGAGGVSVTVAPGTALWRCAVGFALAEGVACALLTLIGMSGTGSRRIIAEADPA